MTLKHESFAAAMPMTRRDRAFGRRIVLVCMACLGLLQAACQLTAPKPVSADTMRVFEPSLATFGDHAILGWHGGETEGNAIYLQRLDAQLKTWSRPLLITDPTAEAFEPDLRALDNDVLLAWYAKQPAPGARSATLARVDWSGHVKWRRVLSQHDARNPVVRVAGDVIWVAWLEDGENETAQVLVERFGADGAALEDPRRAGPASHDTWNLNAAVEPSGTFDVIYDATVGSGAKEIHLISADARGIRRTLLSGDDGVASVYPDIAIQGGRVAVSWVNERREGDQLMLFVGALEALTGTLDATARPLGHFAGHASGAYLAWNGARLCLAWSNTDGRDSRILVQPFDSSGRAMSSSPRRLGRVSPSGHAGVPALGAWRTGFAVAWNEYEQAPGPDGPISHSTALVQSIE